VSDVTRSEPSPEEKPAVPVAEQSDGDETAEVPARAAPEPVTPPDGSMWHTTELAGGPGSVPAPGLWLVFLLVAAAGLLVGIGVAAASRPGPPGRVVAQAMIGPDGGTISFAGRGAVRIPDGALSRPLQIGVRRSVLKQRLRVTPPEGPLYVFEAKQLVAYTFEPRSASFAAPVVITLPLDRTERSGEAFVVLGNTVLFLPGKVDAKTGTVTFKVNDFRFGAGLTGAAG
jgi:hypothetical protein